MSKNNVSTLKPIDQVKRSRKQAKTILCIVAVFLILVALAGANMLIQSINLADTFLNSTKATITSSVEKQDGYSYTATYIVNEKVIEGKTYWIEYEGFVEGDTVDVYYSNSNVDSFIISTEALSKKSRAIYILMILLPFAVGGMYLIFKKNIVNQENYRYHVSVEERL